MEGLKTVLQFLMQLGLSPSYKGQRYLVCAISIVIYNRTYLTNITKNLYDPIAEFFHVRPASVEHCIRTAITVCWEEGNRELLSKIFGSYQNSCPSNSKFIAMIAEYIYLNFSEEELNEKVPMEK